MKKIFQGNKLIVLCISLSLIFLIVEGILIYSRTVNEKASVQGSSELEPSYKELDENSLPVKEKISLEIGSELPKVSDYFETSSEVSPTAIIKYYYDDVEISDASFTNINDDKKYTKVANTYKVLIINDDKEYTSTLEIVDTVAPTVVLKDVYITEGDKYSVKDFLSSYKDNSESNSYTISFKNNDYSKFKNVGTYTVVVTVCDQGKNCVDKIGKLIISEFKLRVIKTIEQEIVVKTEEIKYGVRKITKAKVTYDVYNDGTKKEVSRKKETFTIDQSTFDGTVSEMKSEATQKYNSLSSTRESVLTITNKYRTEKNVPGLKLDPNLSVMATIRAMEIAYSGKFAHERPDGRIWYTIWEDYLGKDASNSVAGENLGSRYSTPETVCQAWYESKEHYDNMINPTFTKIGIGKYEFNGVTYWVQLFED